MTAPEAVANIHYMRRRNAVARHQQKVLRCETLLIAAHRLIADAQLSPRGDKLLRDIEQEIVQK